MRIAKNGFVFGKFYPFHSGHENLITFAKKNCRYLTILVCASENEKLAVDLRVKWIKESFCFDPSVRVLGLVYSENELPNTSVSSREVSRLWAKKFKEILSDIDIVFTGEDYGDYVAEFMNIKHRRFVGDKYISATKIRDDITKYWSFINRSAKSDLVKKVVILGTESTGKSTLAKFLAERFKTSMVSEAGREIVGVSNQCCKSDLKKIAKIHAENIRAQAEIAKRILVIDTDIHITQSYGRFLFNENIKFEEELFITNKADLYIYLDNDAPFVQDGTRFNKLARDALDISHKKVLNEHKVSYKVLDGTYESKYKKAISLIEEILPSGL